MRLSDAFMTDVTECDTIALEVVVKFINVNYEKGAQLLSKCRTMKEYSMLIYRIRVKYRECGDLKAAIEESIRECESVREADGFAAGFERGEAAGFERGETAGKRTIAANLKANGIDSKMISVSTGLTEEEIDKL